MSLPYALTTVSRLKTFAGVSVSTYDTLFEILIDIATDRIEDYCDRRFLESVYTNEKYTGNGSNLLLLNQFPVSSSASFTLEYRENVTNEDNWNTIDSEFYFIDYDNGFIELISSDFSGYGSHFNKNPFGYRVSYTAGYNWDNATTFLQTIGEGALEMACWKIAWDLFSNRKKNNQVVEEEIGDYRVKYGEINNNTLITDDIKALLMPYRRIPG